jgi:hypothetical protein
MPWICGLGTEGYVIFRCAIFLVLQGVLVFFWSVIYVIFFFLAPVFFTLGPLFDRDLNEKDDVEARLITAQMHQLTECESDKFVLCFCGVSMDWALFIFVAYFSVVMSCLLPHPSK